jgi:hypothetical protein
MSPINVALVLVWVVAIALSLAVRPTDCASIRGTWAEMLLSDCPKMKTARSVNQDRMPTTREEYRGFMLTVVPQPNDRFQVDVVPLAAAGSGRPTPTPQPMVHWLGPN